MSSGFAVTKGARRATRIGGRLGRDDKALANRRARRRTRVELQAHGEDADFTVKLYTDWDVI